LNVLIGPNGAGKSNLFESLRLLKTSAGGGQNLQAFFARYGGIGDWIWKGPDGGEASIEVVLAGESKRMPLRYRLAFREQRGRLTIADERLENEKPTKPGKKPFLYIGHEAADVYVNLKKGKKRALAGAQVDPEATLLGVYNAPADYPENARAVEGLKGLRFYSDPLFGRGSTLRQAQNTALPRSLLEEDGSNLALVLNRVLQKPGMRARFTALVREVFPHVDAVDTDTAEGRIQVLFVEKGWKTTAGRLSDGTMRWVFLLTLLLDDENETPVFLDEPDLALHPDALKELAAQLKAASESKQIVVATHNVTFLDHFSDVPEAVVVFENTAIEDQPDLHATRFARLAKSAVPKAMLLGEAWQRGLIGGNRW
jgi:predicted ATPase